MFDHADRGDGIECSVDLAIVDDDDLRPPIQARLGDSLLGQQRLWLGQGDAKGMDAEPLGGVDNERAPAAADVEEPLTRPQVELPADEVELAALGPVELRVGERGVAVGLLEVGAGVDEVGVEEQPVEVVADVVVVADGLGVAIGGVTATPGTEPVTVAGLGRRGGQAQQPAGQIEPAPCGQAGGTDRGHRSHGGDHRSLDVDVAEDERLARVQIGRRDEQ